MTKINSNVVRTIIPKEYIDSIIDDAGNLKSGFSSMGVLRGRQELIIFFLFFLRIFLALLLRILCLAKK